VCKGGYVSLCVTSISRGAGRVDVLILETGDRVEDEARLAAPWVGTFLSAAAMAANIQSQAMMQKCSQRCCGRKPLVLRTKCGAQASRNSGRQD
jgi:hypothetical protein